MILNNDKNYNISYSKLPRITCLVCENSECFSPENVQYCINGTKCWKSSSRDAFGQDKVNRGCDNDPGRIHLCPNNRISSYIKEGQYAVECCASDFCNNGSFPILPSVQRENELAGIHDQSNYLIKLFISIFGVIFFFIIVLVIIAIVIAYFRQRHRKRILAARSLSFNLDEAYTRDAIIRSNTVSNDTLKEYLEQSITSGSGFGLPLLMQRTLSKEITLKNPIGKGKYGEVWRGILYNAEIAVKIFLSKDEASWACETKIYNTVLAKHRNILSFIGSDTTSRNSTTQLWLVTVYHPAGSLYDYLREHSLNYNQMFKIMYSIIEGINHLHEELSGVNDKPSIAHRDIKSKNILVKTDGECVIADFGLAVTYYEKTNEMTVTPNPRVGTKRYMAPEVLDQVINTNLFESYKQADIYSLGLVFWEICWRTVSNGIVEEYKPPFHDRVGLDPSFEDMRKVVCIEERRPLIPNRWASDSILQYIMKITKECWHQKATVRLSSLRIKKNLQKLNL